MVRKNIKKILTYLLIGFIAGLYNELVHLNK